MVIWSYYGISAIRFPVCTNEFTLIHWKRNENGEVVIKGE